MKFWSLFFCVFLADNSLIPKGKRRRNEIGKHICYLYLPTYILSFPFSYLTSIFFFFFFFSFGNKIRIVAVSVTMKPSSLP